jgi:hypothetical protein
VERLEPPGQSTRTSQPGRRRVHTARAKITAIDKSRWFFRYFLKSLKGLDTPALRDVQERVVHNGDPLYQNEGLPDARLLISNDYDKVMRVRCTSVEEHGLVCSLREWWVRCCVLRRVRGQQVNLIVASDKWGTPRIRG